MTGPISEKKTRLGAEQLAARLDQALAGLACLDVLDDPSGRAVALPHPQVVDHPLERALLGAHALDRGDDVLDRQDRLDPQRAAEQRRRRADAPAAAQELERVDREPDLRLLRRRRGPRHHLLDALAPARRRGRASTTRPWPPQALRESTISMRRCPPRAAISAAAWRADSQVPDISLLRCTDTMSLPASTSGSNTARKSPIEGCDVVGRSLLDRRRS